MAQFLGTIPATINGVTQVHLTDVTMKLSPGKVPVQLAGGLAGFSPGSPNVEFTFKSMIPVGGPDFDPYAAALGNEDHDIQFPYGKKTIVSVGQFTECEITSSVTETATSGFSFIGTANPPE